jgi:hypothetical protein
MRRWSCCLIRWRYDCRKQLKLGGVVWSPQCGHAALISTFLLDTGVFATRSIPVIQPWLCPVGLPHVWQFRNNTPRPAIYIWRHRHIRGPEVALGTGLLLLLPGTGRSHITVRQLRERVWWLRGRAREWWPNTALCCTRLLLFAFISSALYPTQAACKCQKLADCRPKSLPRRCFSLFLVSTELPEMLLISPPLSVHPQ